MKDEYDLYIKNGSNWQKTTSGSKGYCDYAAGKYRLKNILVKIVISGTILTVLGLLIF